MPKQQTITALIAGQITTLEIKIRRRKLQSSNFERAY